MRGTWIEIIIAYWYHHVNWSSLMRGTWIEIRCTCCGSEMGFVVPHARDVD